MAKQRIINTRFWDDSYIVSLSTTEKLLFLYLITNPLTNISGVYELPLSRVVFDTGIPRRETEAMLKKLERDGKVVTRAGWIGVVNFIRHQTLNPKVKQGIRNELGKAPKGMLDSLSIDYQALEICYQGLSDLNLNSNTKTNDAFASGLSTERGENLRKGREELVSKWSLRKS